MSERKFASTTISDSEDKLGLTPEQVSQLLADANTSLAKTKGFTQIGDVNFPEGLIFTSLIKLFDPENDGAEMAGVSGIAGIDKDNPAFWAGGTYEQAISLISFFSKMSAGTAPNSGEYAELTKITMLHNGAAKIGDFIIEKSGRIVMVDPATGKPRLVFSSQNIPILADLLSTTNFGDSITAIGTNISIPSSGSSTSYLSGILNVTKNSADISIDGGAVLNLEGSFGGTADASVILSLYLMRNGSKHSNLQSVMISKGANIESFPVDARTLTGMPSGNYRLMLEVTKVGTGQVSGQGSITSIPMSWAFQQSGIRNFLFGLDGFLSYFSDRHIYFSEEDGFDLRGKTNMPGVLAKGRIMESGTRDVSKAWGDKNSTSTITKPSGVGSYRVPVNCKNGDYDVNISPRTANRTFQAGITTATYFEVFFRDHNGNAANSEFSYTLVGNNY